MSRWGDPTSIFAPLSDSARAVDLLSHLVLVITAAIFAIVLTLILVAVIRFRRRAGDDGREPAQVYGSNQMELAWTVLPVLVVTVLVISGARVIQDVTNARPQAGEVDVVVIGHQWWWEIHYPKLGVVTANELHLPAGKLTWIELRSADVAHSFWVPRLGGKTDLIPGRANHTWIRSDEPGLYLGQCAEFCGTQHAKMLLRVYVDRPEDFQRWTVAQADPRPSPEAVAAGKRVFESNACINCHTVAGTVGNGRFGPNLTHLMSRATLAAGAADNVPALLRTWIADPDRLKPGAHMPAMKLSPEEIDELVDYLSSLR